MNLPETELDNINASGIDNTIDLYKISLVKHMCQPQNT
jgi:hypothetical protein